MNWNFWVCLGALANALAVALGAFGTHFLKTRLLPDDLLIYETAIRYLFIHATALILVGLLAKSIKEPKSLRLASALFVAGILIFCGSLFLLVATQIRVLGAITPIRGLCFISGWLIMAKAYCKA